MSMSSCEKCWGCPCECGYEYRDKPVSWLIQMRDLFDKLSKEGISFNTKLRNRITREQIIDNILFLTKFSKVDFEEFKPFDVFIDGNYAHIKISKFVQPEFAEQIKNNFTAICEGPRFHLPKIQITESENKMTIMEEIEELRKQVKAIGDVVSQLRMELDELKKK